MSQQRLTESHENTKQVNGHCETSPASGHSLQGGLHPNLQLQRMLGNRLVGRLIQAKRLTPEGKIIGLQRKLTLGAANNRHEQEADRVARQVLNTPDAVAADAMQRAMQSEINKGQILQIERMPTSISSLAQRQTVNTEQSEDKEPIQIKLTETNRELLPQPPGTAEEETETIRTKPVGSMFDGFEVGDALESQINQNKGDGVPLPEAVRAYMEPRFGVDFGHVRVHSGSDAVEMNQAVGAQAFTHGSDIYFGAGQNVTKPELTAHELVHVVQQTGGAPLQRVQTTKREEEVSLSSPGPAIRAAVGSLNQLQRDPDNNKDDEYVPYPIKVPQGIKTEEELDRYAEILIFGKRMNFKWQVKGWNVEAFSKAERTVTYGFPTSFVAKYGGKKAGEANRPRATNPAYNQTKGAERSAINEEIDKRYSEKTGIPKEQKIKAGEKANIDMWNVYRDQVINDKMKLKDLPPELKALLGGEPSFKPQDYEHLIRVAQKLKQFTPEDVAVYKMLSLRATDNLDLFEKSVDMFLVRKAELREALKNYEAQKKGKDPQSMQGAIEDSWKGFDSSKVGKMSEADQYDLARQQTWEVTKAQLEYMKNHPGETAVDFLKTATLMNQGDTFKGIGRDIAEAANGDANSWARWAAGTGAGAKLSGWLLAVGGVLYVLSWLTGVGELATIAAFMGAMLASTIVLSETESELRIKAASQAKTPEQFKSDVTKAAVARTNVLLMLGALALALAIRFVAKTFFPSTVAKISQSLARFREKVRIVGKLSEVKTEFLTEMEGHRQKLLEAGESAKESAKQQADALDKMSLQDFVDKLESGGGDYFQEAAVQEGQKVPWKALAKTPEGLKSIESYKARLTDGLRNAVPKEIDVMVKEQADAISAMMDKVKASTIPDEFDQAIKDHEQFMSNEEVAKRGKAKEEQMRKEKTEESLTELEQEIKKYELSAKSANELIAKAVAEQETVTADLTEVAKTNGATMEGLDKAVKTESSLTRKISDRVRSRDVESKGLEKAVEISAGKINDALRFTMILDFKTYVAKILAIKAALEAKGYQFVKLWNGWTQSDGTYMGVNATFKTPKGQLFELQFHTSESFKIKSQTHGLYDEARSAVATEAEKAQLAQQQKAAYQGIEIPADIGKVDEIK